MERKSRPHSPGLLILSIFFLLTYVAGLQAEPVIKPVLFVENSEFHFGTVRQGTKVEHAFRVRNQGNADLEIKRVVAACGCTATLLDENLVKPGGETKIKVTFDTGGFSGEKLKTVRLYTNDGDQGASILSIRGTVEPDVLVQPARINFGNVIARNLLKEVSQELTVNVRQASDVNIVGIKSYSQYLNIEELDAENGGRRYKVTLSPETPIGDLRERVVLSVQGEDRSSINVPVFASVQGDLSLSATTVSFGIIEGNERLSRNVRLRDVGDRKVTIKEIRSSNPAVTAEHRLVEDGNEHIITVHVDPERITRDLRASLDIIVDHAEQGSLPLSVYGVLPPQM